MQVKNIPSHNKVNASIDKSNNNEKIVFLNDIVK